MVNGGMSYGSDKKITGRAGRFRVVGWTKELEYEYQALWRRRRYRYRRAAITFARAVGSGRLAVRFRPDADEGTGKWWKAGLSTSRVWRFRTA